MLELSALKPWLVWPAKESDCMVLTATPHVKRVLTWSDCTDFDTGLFLVFFLWDCSPCTFSLHCPPKKKATYNKSGQSLCVFACGGFDDGEDRGAGNERALVEKDGVCVSVEVVRDMRCVIPGFLKDHSMEATTGGRNDLRVVLASRAWIPLEHREASLEVHEVTDGVVEWALPAGVGLTTGTGLGKGS